MPHRPHGADDHAAFARERQHLLNLGYRLLGSLSEAEDAVQETYARWYALTPEQQAAVENPGAWLTTVATRVCLDQLKSARVRRERYVGEWLPEPLPDADPSDRVTLDESVNMALLVVLEEMTPAERVAFILHDVFRYPFAEIGEIVGRSPEACRQLASSARRRVDRAAGVATPTREQAQVVAAFQRAWKAQDVEALLALFDPDAVVIADGGGLAPAARRPIAGAAALARHLARLVRGTRELGVELVETTVNGRPGIAGLVGGTTVIVLAFALEGGRIRHVWAIANPEKLAPWNGGADQPAAAVRRRASRSASS